MTPKGYDFIKTLEKYSLQNATPLKKKGEYENFKDFAQAKMQQAMKTLEGVDLSILKKKK